MNRALLACLALTSTTGCGTIASIHYDDPYPNIVYGGVRRELAPVSPHTVLDIPFCAAADTIVLPYTIPRSIYNQAHPENKPEYDELGDLIPRDRNPTTAAASRPVSPNE